MSPDQSTSYWIGQLQAGNEEAASQLWRRYFDQLVHLARKSLGNAPRRAADEEDVVVSAFESFCRGAKEGSFPDLDDRCDLWQILVMITARKASNQAKRDRRLKRGGGRVRGESVFERPGEDSQQQGIADIAGAEPTPEFAALLAETCRQMLDALHDPELQAMVVWKMEGYTNEEIARKADRCVRTVERKLQLIRRKLHEGGFDERECLEA
jgi:RNA polymerase sigma factor (sigma-70 family)